MVTVTIDMVAVPRATRQRDASSLGPFFFDFEEISELESEGVDLLGLT